MECLLRPGHRDTLKRWLRRPTTPSGQTGRARILVALDGGRSATKTDPDAFAGHADGSCS